MYIGELSQVEMRIIEPGLRIRVVDRLLDRYVGEQGNLDIFERRRSYQMAQGTCSCEASLYGSGLRRHLRLSYGFLTPL
jgi:hypothetical protein